MDVLVALGTSAAYFYSCGAVIESIINPSSKPVHIFFETSVLLIFFILFGKFLEASARGKTMDSLSKLMSLQPDTAIIVNNDEKRTVDISLLQIGDLVQIAAGDRVPADGIVVNGSSYCDESMISGESRAVSKNVGDELLGGTVNEVS